MARTKPAPGTLLDPSHPSLSGAVACWLLTEGRGTTPADSLGRRAQGSFVGAPTWGVGTMGPTLSGFSSSNYVVLDRPQVLGSTYPFWIATLATNTATTPNCYTLNQGSGSGGNATIGLTYNGSPGTGTVAGQACYVLRDNSAAAFSPQFTDAVINDGKPHVLMGVSYAANDHRIYLDGLQRGTSTTTLGTCDGSQMTLGVFRRNATITSTGFTGQVIACAVGNRLVPDPAALARSWLAGDFGAAPGATARRYFLPPSAAGFRTPLAIGMLGRVGVPTAAANFSFAATLDAATLAASLTAATPASSAMTFAPTLEDASLAASLTAAAAGAASATFSPTLDASGLASSFTAAAPAAAAATFSTTLGGSTLVASLTAAVPASAAATFSATLDASALAASLAASAAPASDLSFATTTAASILAASLTAATPASSAATFAATLADATLAASLAASSPASAAATFATTLGAATLASAYAASGAGDSTITFATTTAASTLAASFAAGTPASSALALATTLDAATLSSSFAALVPGASFAFAATLDAAALASSLAAAAPASSSAAFAATLDGATLASSFASTAAGEVSFAFAATTAATLAATLDAVAVPGSVVTFGPSLDDASLVSTFVAAAPAASSFAFAKTLGNATLAASVRSGAIGLTAFNTTGRIHGADPRRGTGRVRLDARRTTGKAR